MKTLTEDQINRLFQFCERHYVRYYDVQVELVDHIASNIENIMSQDSSITFEEALEKTYSQFGKMGFGKYMSEKEKQITIKLRKNKNKQLLQFFTFPKIVLTILFYTFLLLPVWKKDIELARYFGFLICISMAIFSIFTFVKIWKENKRVRKKLFLLDSSSSMNYGTFNSITICVFIPFFIRLISNENEMQLGLKSYVYFMTIAFFAILMSIILYKQYKQLLKNCQKDYPFAFE